MICWRGPACAAEARQLLGKQLARAGRSAYPHPHGPVVRRDRDLEREKGTAAPFVRKKPREVYECVGREAKGIAVGYVSPLLHALGEQVRRERDMRGTLGFGNRVHDAGKRLMRWHRLGQNSSSGRRLGGDWLEVE